MVLVTPKDLSIFILATWNSPSCFFLKVYGWWLHSPLHFFYFYWHFCHISCLKPRVPPDRICLIIFLLHCCSALLTRSTNVRVPPEFLSLTHRYSIIMHLTFIHIILFLKQTTTSVDVPPPVISADHSVICKHLDQQRFLFCASSHQKRRGTKLILGAVPPSSWTLLSHFQHISLLSCSSHARPAQLQCTSLLLQTSSHKPQLPSLYHLIDFLQIYKGTMRFWPYLFLSRKIFKAKLHLWYFSLACCCPQMLTSDLSLLPLLFQWLIVCLYV